jgi:hypothetical protein
LGIVRRRKPRPLTGSDLLPTGSISWRLHESHGSSSVANPLVERHTERTSNVGIEEE